MNKYNENFTPRLGVSTRYGIKEEGSGMERLKECPFCGGHATMIIELECNSESSCQDFAEAAMKMTSRTDCSDCRGSFVNSEIIIQLHQVTMDAIADAVNGWNARPETKVDS